jgi:hypothetical protein
LRICTLPSAPVLNSSPCQVKVALPTGGLEISPKNQSLAGYVLAASWPKSAPV